MPGLFACVHPAGDALVLRRLMELLSAPLSAWHRMSYTVPTHAYAEWVGTVLVWSCSVHAHTYAKRACPAHLLPLCTC